MTEYQDLTPMTYFSVCSNIPIRDGTIGCCGQLTAAAEKA